MAASGDLRERLAQVGGSPAAQRVTGLWRNKRYGSTVRSVVGLLALLAVLKLALRNNPPSSGIYVYGAIIGLLYSLLAMGLILIYRANRIINFAQAEIGAAAAVMAVLLIKVHHVPYVVAFALAIVTGVVSGMVVEFGVVRRFNKASRLVLSVATIGVALIFAGIQLFLPGWLGGKQIDPNPPRTPFSGIHFTVGNFRFDANAFVIVFFVALVVAGLTAFFRFTDIGLAVRGSAENADRAALLGIPVKRVSTVVWIISGALSALSIFLRIPVIGLPVGVFVGPTILLFGLAAAVIARMESFSVALVAGVALGIIEQCLYYFSRDPSIAGALILPILLAAMLVQRSRLSRGQDTGMATWQLAREFRPIPPELRSVPEVVWGRLGLSVAAVAILLLGFEALPLKQQILSSVVVIYGIVAVSLVILTGWAGQISLGQWGFAGIGAAIAGNLVARHNADLFVTVVVAGVAGAVAALIIGLPAIRITGLYLAVTTLALSITIQDYFLSRVYFRGFLPTHAQTIVRPVLYGQYSLTGDRAFFYTCLVVLGLALLSARAMRRSRTGRVIIAVRDNQKGAQAYAVGAAKTKLWAFAISGFWAAVAGALFAYHQGVVETVSFPPDLSLTLLIIVVIGGVTSLPGALLGTLLIGMLKFGDIGSGLTDVLIGFFALLLLYVLPGGLAQGFYGVRDALLRWIATRRGIVVPSLLADVRTATPQAEADVLAQAAASVEGAAASAAVPAGAGARAESGNGNGNGRRRLRGVSDGEASGSIRCPACGQIVPLDAVPDHDHFKVVAS